MTGGAGTARPYFLPLFLKIPISIFNARHTGGEGKHFQVSDWTKKEKKKSPDGFQTKPGGGGGNFPTTQTFDEAGCHVRAPPSADFTTLN